MAGTLRPGEHPVMTTSPLPLDGSSPAEGARLLRPLGTLERLYHLWSSRHPMHHCLTVQLEAPASRSRWQHAITALRRRHPLLDARVVEAEDGPWFAAAPHHEEPAGDAGGVTTGVLGTTTAHEWTEVVAAELAAPLIGGRLFRATVLPGGDTAVLVFGHEALDGRAAASVAADLPAALAGRELPPLRLPAAREELLATDPGVRAVLEAGPAAPPAVDPRLRVPAQIRPFDGAAPVVSALRLEQDLTGRLRTRARAERCTVHAALVTALARVVAAERGLEAVRVLSPIDVRASLPASAAQQPATAAEGLLLHVGRTLAQPGGEFWAAAREQVAALAPHRDALAAARAAAAQEAFVGARAGAEDAERLMAGGALGLDVLVSNLGALPTIPGVRGLWGPSMLNQVLGEQVVGALTLAGRLHLTCVSHAPVPGLLERTGQVLEAALA